MAVQFFLPDGSPLILKDAVQRVYKGIRLPGSKIWENGFKSASISIQEFDNPLFSISHRIFELFAKVNLTINERPGLRLEAILAGEVDITHQGKRMRLREGQYHLTNVPLFTALFKKSSSCRVFITHYSEELLNQLGFKFEPSLPGKMTGEMVALIQEIIRNPYGEDLRDFYYANCVRELLFFHLKKGKVQVPGNLENKDISIVFQADTFMASNLSKKLTIESLSRVAGTNQFKLKKGFKQIFGMGVFRRLLHLRMEHAKKLLETTNKTIGEIAQLAGYDTAAGFIHAFRREFDMTPREWRTSLRDSEEEDERCA